MQPRALPAARQLSATVTSRATAIDQITTAEPVATSSDRAGPNSDNICLSGLNGLSSGGVEGLDTVCYFACTAVCLLASFVLRVDTAVYSTHLIWVCACNSSACSALFLLQLMLYGVAAVCRAVSTWLHNSLSYTQSRSLLICYRLTTRWVNHVDLTCWMTGCSDAAHTVFSQMLCAAVMLVLLWFRSDLSACCAVTASWTTSRFISSQTGSRAWH